MTEFGSLPTIVRSYNLQISTTQVSAMEHIIWGELDGYTTNSIYI